MTIEECYQVMADNAQQKLDHAAAAAARMWSKSTQLPYDIAFAYAREAIRQSLPVDVQLLIPEADHGND